jgi:hypothetical protein
VHGPFLMSPENEYQQSKTKLLIIGQETNGWSTTTNISTQMSAYREFGLGKTYNSPFWSIARKLEQAIGTEPCSCAWTNINKYDEKKKRPKQTVREATSELNDILKEEIKLSEPEICVFFVGPRYHKKIMEMYPSVEFVPVKGWKRNALTKLSHPKLPKETFITYHPKYLRISKLESDFINFFGELKP